MSNLPGNPHAKSCEESVANTGEHTIAEEGLTDATIIWTGITHLVEATLAVAYEQRTANLIAQVSVSVQLEAATRGNDRKFSKAVLDVIDEINARLGQEATK